MAQAPALRVVAVCAALVALSVAAMSGIVENGFLNFDDDTYVTANAHVLQGIKPGGVAWAFASTEGANWHPVTWLSHMLDVQMFGTDAGKHHRTSLLLHTVNAVLLFLLLLRMTGALARSAFASALFAVHPLHVESVAWVAERKDVLSTLFWLLTTGAWLRYVEAKSAGRYAVVIALFALGLMSKPMLVTLPFTLLLLEFWPLKRAGSLRERVIEKAPLFAMAAASCVITVIAQQRGGAFETLAKVEPATRAANAIVAYTTYLGRTFWPASLSIFYPYPFVLSPVLVIGSAATLAGLTVLAFRAAGHAPYFTVGWLWYVGTLVPVIGLVQVGAQATADRYTYIPLVGVFVALAWGLGELAARHPAARVAAAAVALASLVPLLLASRAQAQTFKDSATVFTHALSVDPSNDVAHINLGLSLFNGGKLDEAIQHYEAALKIKPDSVTARNDLGVALHVAGRDAEAAEQLRLAIDGGLRSAEAQVNYGTALAGTGQIDAAIERFNEALRIDPGSAEATRNLANLLSRTGRHDEALARYDRLVELRPDDATARFGRATALAGAGRFDEAQRELESGLRLKPDSPVALNFLGNLLARQGRLPEAIARYEEAARLKPEFAEALNNLGQAYGTIGRLPESIEKFQAAIRANPSFAQAYNNLGISLLRADRIPEAVTAFEAALKLRPDFEQARENLRGAQEARAAHR